MISAYRATFATVVLLFCVALLAGCGNTFRPTIISQPQPGGDPGTLGQALVLATNPSGRGSDTHIDVSGDSNSGVVTVGQNPVFLGKAGARAFVINHSTTPPNPDSVTTYIALLPQSTAISTITLPATSTGPVAGGTSRTGGIYIANSGTNDVTFIPPSTSAVQGTIAVGTRPVAVAGGTTSLDKVYVVNQGSNNVTVISSLDNSVLTTIPVGTAPIWAVMSSDDRDLFVVNQGSNSISVIDTFGDAVIENIPVGASPNFAFYDAHLKRVYVSNTGGSSISIIKADLVDLSVSPPLLPTLLATVPVSGSPTSVTALSDGTRAYAALGGCPAGVNHLTLLSTVTSGGCTGNSVSVIDVLGFRESKVIFLGSGTVSIDASSDATRVYAVNAHDANVSIIRTASDTELTDSGGHPVRMAAPLQNLSCNDPASCPATAQIPFMVRTFP